MKILGVDLGSYSIKVAELETSTKGFVISNFFEFPLSTDPNVDRGLQIIEALRGLAGNYQNSDTRWVIGVPQHRVSVRFKRFPFRERPKIYKTLAFELEDDIPFDLDETVFDFKIVEFVGSSADVLAVAAPKEVVADSLEVAKDGGFDPEIVSVEGLALANIFENWNEPPREVSATLRSPDDATGLSHPPTAHARVILHLGHTRSLFLVYRNGSLINVRSIQWGGSEIADSLARAFNIPLYEAMKLLVEKSFILMNSAGAQRDQITLSQAVASQVDNLIRELKLTLLEVKSAFNLEFDQIELSGGISQVQNLAPYLTQGLELPCNVNPHVLADKPSRLTPNAATDAVAAVAVGLAIEGMKRSRRPALNLRKDEFARENLNLKRFWEKWRVPAQVAASAFAIFFGYSVVRDQVAASLDAGADEHVQEAALKAAALKGSAANESAIQKYLRTQKDRLKHQEALSQLDEYVGAIDIVAKLSEKMPARAPIGQGFDLSLVNVENDDVEIQGRAASAAQVTLIQKALNEMAAGQKVAAVPGTTPGATGQPFGFKFKVKRKN